MRKEMNKGKVLWLDEGRRVKAMQIFLKLKNGPRLEADKLVLKKWAI